MDINPSISLKVVPTKNFSSGKEMIAHAAANIASFWLSYSAKCIEQDQPILFLSDCVNDLVDQECNREIYSDITIRRLPDEVEDDVLKKVKGEIARITISEAKTQIQEGKYPSVRNRIVDMNEVIGVMKVKIRSAFNKQI